MSWLYTQKSQVQKRQALRNNPTQPEIILWERLRGKQIGEIKFRRQYSIGPYVVDFYAPKKRLAIEIDGDSHFTNDAAAYDHQRQQYIEACGIHFLRFTNQDIQTNLSGVLEQISAALLPSNEGRNKVG